MSTRKSIDERQCGVSPYDNGFFESIDRGSLDSARAVVPALLNLVPVESVVDFGCGWGAWLSGFQECGVESLLGIDGDYVDRDKFMVEGASFQHANLCEPVALEQAFDLAVCLEVAEHLSARHAEVLINSLVRAAPIVLFSAALPGQQGTSHLNEQWPAYWEKLFRARGFQKYDVIRPQIFFKPDVKWWYKQNIYLYASTDLENLKSVPSFEPGFTVVSTAILNQLNGYSSRPFTSFVLALSSLKMGIQRLLTRG